MNKRKLFTVVTSVVLLFTSGSQTILAVAEDNNTEDSWIENDEIPLKDILNEDDTNLKYEFLNDVINDVKVEIKDNVIIFSGIIPNTYDLVLRQDDKEEVLAVGGESFVVELSKDTLYENNKTLLLINNEDQSLITEIDLQFMIEDDSDEEVGKSEELTVDEQSEDEESIEERTEEEQNSVKETVSDNEEINEDSSVEEEIAENPVYEVKEYDTPSSEFSYSRFYEVEELLHGELDGDLEKSEENQPRLSPFSTSSTRTASNGIYTVRSGDLFNAIADSFNLSTRQLAEWNRHVPDINSLSPGTQLAVNRSGVESMLSDSDKERLYEGGATPEFSTRQEFIDTIAPMAIEVANQEGQEALWPSLMIAQAAHESAFGTSSLASPPYHNLSGIKGSHNGNSTLMWTWEQYGGEDVDVLAAFRHYPSYTASLEDYANLLRNGLSWDSQYYSGTWRSNTTSVWDVIENEGLAGYATDSNYYNSLTRTINEYNLTQYDTGNYYVRTGTFLGEDFTQLQVDRLKSENHPFNYRIEREENKPPYSYRRVESTQEFLGEPGAQRAIDQLRREHGWSASMIPTGNSTQRFRVRSGFFNSLPEAERALNRFTDTSGYSARIERGSDNKYRLQTGFFNGRSSADRGIRAMQELGWSARGVGSNDSTPHYNIRTGTFNTPKHVNRATDYFNSNGWGSQEIEDSRNNYYYRIFIEGISHEAEATSFVNHLRQQFNWSSTSFLVDD